MESGGIAAGEFDAAGTTDGCISYYGQVANNNYVFAAHVVEGVDQ